MIVIVIHELRGLPVFTTPLFKTHERSVFAIQMRSDFFPAAPTLMQTQVTQQVTSSAQPFNVA